MAGWGNVIAQILNTLTKAYSTYQSGRDMKAAGEYNATVAENQAQWAEYNAQRQAEIARNQAAYAEYNAALAKTEAEANAAKEGKRLTAAQRARYGKAGVLLQGTPLEVLADTMVMVDNDRLGILKKGEIEAYGWRTKAWKYRTDAGTAMTAGASKARTNRITASLNRMKGAQAGRGGMLKAGKTVLTGFMDTYKNSQSLFASRVPGSSSMDQYFSFG